MEQLSHVQFYPGKGFIAFFVQFAQLLSRLNQIVSGYKSLDSLMKQPTEHPKGNEFMRRDRYEGEINFDNTSYSYPNQDSDAVENISFKIGKGERIGLVGRVGSGKTTVGKLITKLFLPQTGSISIDGIDIRQLDPSEIRENIGYVAQEPWLIARYDRTKYFFGSYRY